jgi:hypothetical protein
MTATSAPLACLCVAAGLTLLPVGPTRAADLPLPKSTYTYKTVPAVGPQRREFSGKFNVRILKSLHAALVREAEAEAVSLNQFVLAKLPRHL